MIRLALIVLLIGVQGAMAQVGIGTISPNASSALDISSTSSGLLIPRMSESQRTGISSPATGLIVYQTDSTAGFWYFDGSNWTRLATTVVQQLDDLTDGKSDNDGTQNGSSVFIGINTGANDDSSDNKNTGIGYDAFSVSSTSRRNSFLGYQALKNNTGNFNTAIGYQSLFSNTNGVSNVALGTSALAANTTGSSNIAIGAGSMESNNMGDSNIAIGVNSMRNASGSSGALAIGTNALAANTTGSFNTAIGTNVLQSNITGRFNLGVGYNALANFDGDNYNVAVGYQSMLNMTTGEENVGLGKRTLASNEGDSNTALGNSAMGFSTTGEFNTAVGRRAMAGNTTGSYNVSIGADSDAGSSSSYSTAVGYAAVAGGNYNTVVGYSAGINATGDNLIAIGNGASISAMGASNEIRLGNTNITSARVQVAWTITSDEKWKANISDLSYGLDFLSKLRPVDYYRKGDNSKEREIGFIAQEVQQTVADFGMINYGLLTKDSEGTLEMRYNDLIGVLVKATQEQQQIIEEQQITLERLNTRLEEIEAMLESGAGKF